MNSPLRVDDLLWVTRSMIRMALEEIKVMRQTSPNTMGIELFARSRRDIIDEVLFKTAGVGGREDVIAKLHELVHLHTAQLKQGKEYDGVPPDIIRELRFMKGEV